MLLKRSHTITVNSAICSQSLVVGHETETFCYTKNYKISLGKKSSPIDSIYLFNMFTNYMKSMFKREIKKFIKP